MVFIGLNCSGFARLADICVINIVISGANIRELIALFFIVHFFRSYFVDLVMKFTYLNLHSYLT